MITFLNGKFIPHNKAVISVDDHGFLYGDGVYETLRVYKGNVFLLKEHLSRLKHSADWIGLRLPLSFEKLGKALVETARRNHHAEAVLRLTVTRGPGAYGFDPALCKPFKPTVSIVSRPFQAYPSWFHQKGIAVAIVSIRRNAVASLPPHVKSTSCMNGIYAKVESLKLKAQEGLMLSNDGFLTEATVSNVFLVKKGVLQTPMLDGSLLAGTTRGFVIGLAKKAAIPVAEKKLTLENIMSADEIFLTNTTMEVLPVSHVIDGSGYKSNIKRHARRPVGPLTQKLQTLFTRYLKENMK